MQSGLSKFLGSGILGIGDSLISRQTEKDKAKIIAASQERVALAQIGAQSAQLKTLAVIGVVGVLGYMFMKRKKS